MHTHIYIYIYIHIYTVPPTLPHPTSSWESAELNVGISIPLSKCQYNGNQLSGEDSTVSAVHFKYTSIEDTYRTDHS